MAEKIFSQPAVSTPTLSQLEEISERLGLGLKGTNSLEEYQKFIAGAFSAINSIDGLPEPTLPVKYPRTPGYRPLPKDNPLNAWYWKCDIQGAESGLLSGKTVAIKDNVCVAGVPMMNGSSALEGYVPEFDATVVTRLLDAGARITGKAVCENMCTSGGSFTCNKGPVKNFHNPEHSAGGSSGGSASLLAAGEVDLAIGGDQGGSIRMPACWSGVVGLKPTHGLVPYTGAIAMDPSIDHLGPMARTVDDCALMLEVLAGYDNGLDPRQRPDIVVPEYTKQIKAANLNGVRVGLLKEGFGAPQADPLVGGLVRNAAEKLTEFGATVEEVSVSTHLLGMAVWTAFGYEGIGVNMLQCGGGGTGHKGFYPTSFLMHAGKSLKASMNDLSHPVKCTAIIAEYLKDYYPGQFYGKGQNLRRYVKQEFDEAFKNYDVLIMPTIPFTATKLPTVDHSIAEYFQLALSMCFNTMTFDVTGHPALSVNVGYLEGLPVGLQIVGGDYEESKVLKVGRFVEKLCAGN